MGTEFVPTGLDLATIAEIIAVRDAHGTPQTVLARRSGVSLSSLNRYLAAERPMNLGAVDKIADALGIGFWELMRRAQERLNEVQGTNA